jgi:hypothetical protein
VFEVLGHIYEAIVDEGLDEPLLRRQLKRKRDPDVADMDMGVDGDAGSESDTEDDELAPSPQKKSRLVPGVRETDDGAYADSDTEDDALTLESGVRGTYLDTSFVLESDDEGDLLPDSADRLLTPPPAIASLQENRWDASTTTTGGDVVTEAPDEMSVETADDLGEVDDAFIAGVALEIVGDAASTALSEAISEWQAAGEQGGSLRDAGVAESLRLAIETDATWRTEIEADAQRLTVQMKADLHSA